MPRKKSGDFDEYKYQQNYIKENLKFVNVPFNSKFPEELALYDYLNDHAKETGEKKGAFIKRLIRESMVGKTPTMQEIVEDIDFPEQEYEDREAIRNALEKKHSIYATIRGNYKVEIDVDEKKVLSVKDFRRMLIGF